MNKNHLVIFDIDGTLTDTSEIDDSLYRQTFFDLYNLKLLDNKWEEYKKLSSHNDNGTAINILRNELNIDDIQKELENFKSYFMILLKNNSKKFTEIPGASDFFNELRANNNFIIGVATGSWRNSGIIKLNSIGISVDKIPYGNADLYNTRKEIISYVISQAKEMYNATEFTKITYIGDGEWDLVASRDLRIDFIGIDSRNDGMLKSLDVKKITNNFINKNLLYDLLI
ncbi:MAG: HAD hydrolase-like protein [FCB group bacterium]|jgi:phosphoglycolate phosphatase-like HAD superfamily hydrolase